MSWLKSKLIKLVRFIIWGKDPPKLKSSVDVVIEYLDGLKIKPSRDFNDDQYYIFLNIADPNELENDFVSDKNRKKILDATGFIPPKQIQIGTRY